MCKRETTHQERIEIVELRLAGISLRQIAQQKRLNYYTVRHWWRVYRDGGWDALIPKARQRPREGPLSTFDPLVRYVALRLKWEHPN